MRTVVIVFASFIAITTASAVVHANKIPHFVIRSTGSMPAVNVP
jgi:hypothetical protein